MVRSGKAGALSMMPSLSSTKPRKSGFSSYPSMTYIICTRCSPRCIAVASVATESRSPMNDTLKGSASSICTMKYPLRGLAIMRSDVPVKHALICTPGNVKRGCLGFWKQMRPIYWMWGSSAGTTFPCMGSVVDAKPAIAIRDIAAVMIIVFISSGN